ncbi:uncharacterized protein LY89DRAFT_739875 [Mollisia scopiformis]|uniref:Uncharacterized protein n=1 Tax=Mollisia scopiformis TaxID=149040 RepID=A0A194WSF3_MOLSC|nr:uncharacterized protein LY89DRAFT_739875 [Mollisia scopiformis]KUJ10893.1 hypothetical protein LY89DRAFT_739875 [Mollisia scopiformis]
MLRMYREVVIAVALLLTGHTSAAALPAPSDPLIDILNGESQGFNGTATFNSTEIQDNAYQYRWYHGGTCNWADTDKGTVTWGGWSHCIDKPDNTQWTSLEFDRPTYVCAWCGKGCNGGGSRYSQPSNPVTCMRTPSYCNGLGSFVAYQP